MATTVTCSCSALGAVGKLLTESTGTAPRTFNSVSLRHEFIYESVGTMRPVQSTNAITGYLAKMSTSARAGQYLTQGTIALQASPKELTKWLPRIFGGPISGTDVALSNSLPAFDCLVYRENGIFHYTDCLVAQAVLRGKTANGGESVSFMDLIVSIIGKQELIDVTTWPATEPTLGTTAASLPYTFWETDLTLNSSSVEFESIQIAVNNHLSVQFFNKQYPSCIRATGRDINIALQAPFTCNNLTEALALHDGDGTGAFVLESGNMSTTLEFPALRNDFKTPTIPGKTTVPIQLALEAYSPLNDGVNVVITHDDTP